MTRRDGRKLLRLAVTGEPGCGKTTLLCRAVERLRGELRVGGFYTEEIRLGRKRTGFAIVDIASGARGTLAHVDLEGGPRVGRYGVSRAAIAEVAIPALAMAAGEVDLIVIDEVAPMECASPEFVAAVTDLLDTERPLLVAVHRQARGALLERIRAEFEILEVTRSNRDGLVATIVETVRNALGDSLP